jgi:ABC-type transport system involved in cytochrome c biogenesis permease subunit
MIPSAIAFGLYLFGIASRPLALAGFALQAGYLVYRGLTLGRLPLVGVHDTLGFLSASVMAFGLGVDHAWGKEKGFIRALSGIAAFFTLIAMLQKPHVMPLPPVLKTYWFELHVALSFFSYALFGIAAVLGGFHLRLRDPETDKLGYKTAFVGYALFSLSMIFGGVWAFLAWGTYWLWTPKELWTSLLWLYYALYLHLRYMKWWKPGYSAIMAIAGFGLVLFTYLGVSLLMKSSHTF